MTNPRDPNLPPPINKHYRIIITDAQGLEGIQSDLSPPIPSWFWQLVSVLREGGFNVRVQEPILMDVTEQTSRIQ
jgi:hypothetical protein